MRKQKSEKTKLVEAVLAGNKKEAMQAISVISQYKSTDFIVFFEREDGLFEYNGEGLLTREEIEKDFKNPILFVHSKPLKTSEDEE